jgi:hypothetical protein
LIKEDLMYREQRGYGEVRVSHECSSKNSVRKDSRAYPWESELHINALIELRNASAREAR